MVEPLTIFGTISAAIGLLNLARQGIKSVCDDKRKYQAYGKTLLTFYHEVEILQQSLDLWQKKWDINDPHQGGEGVRYFGSEGWGYVQKELALIDDIFFSLVGLLASFDFSAQISGSTIGTATTRMRTITIGATTRTGRAGMMTGTDTIARTATTASTITVPIPPESVPDVSKRNKLRKHERMPADIQKGREFIENLPKGRIKLWQEFKADTVFLDEQSAFARKVAFVLESKEDVISKKIAELGKRCDQLERISERYFEAIYTELSASMPYEERQRFVQREWDSDYALLFRENAISMVSALPPTILDPKEIGLELNAQRNPRTSPEVVDYTLITEPLTPGGSYALSVQALGHDSASGAQSFPTFPAAYRQAQKGYAVLLRVRRQTAPDLYYSITASRLVNNTFTERLADGFRNRHDLSLRERVELAYRLADSCLLLLNTSWMSAFSSESVIRIEAQEPVRYFLGFREGDRARCQLLGQLSHSSEPQAYSIGILLIELATQRKVTEFHENGEEPILLKVNGDEELSLNEAIYQTKRAVGPSFSQVVEHCFYGTKIPPDHDNAILQEEHELEMLHNFHENVFFP
jgi:hypothetical protein